MKRHGRNFLFLAILSASFAWGFAESSLPVVDILGNKYYIYKSQKGESLFKIAKENGWDESVLLKLNPEAVSPLPKDFTIYYPVDNLEGSSLPIVSQNEVGLAASDGDKGGSRYTIKPGDTLFALASSNSTTVAEIMRLNPGVSERNFRAGDTIILPAPGSGVKIEEKEVEETTLNGFSKYKVGKDESWSGVSRKTGVSVERLKEANPGISRLKNKMVISIPIVETVTEVRAVETKDPREESAEGIKEIYAEVHKLSDNVGRDTLRVAIVLAEPSARKDLEFSRGFLTALYHLRGEGKPVSLKIVDGTDKSTDIITSLDEYKPSIVFSSADKNIPSYLGEYSRVSCTPTVNVFDVKNDFYLSNPYMIQLTTPSEEFNASIAEYIADRFGDRTLVFAGQEDSDDALAAALRAVWSPGKLMSVTTEHISDFPLSDSSKILVYGNPIKKGEVSSLLEAVEGLKEMHPLADIAVIGRPNWIVFDESLSEHFHKAGVLIPSRFYYDPKSRQASSFEALYRNLFSRAPQNTFPMYAPFGYDAAIYFVEGLLKTGYDINRIPDSSDGVQSDFSLKRDNSWSGLMNPVVYLVEFTPFGTIEKNKVK